MKLEFERQKIQYRVYCLIDGEIINPESSLSFQELEKAEEAYERLSRTHGGEWIIVEERVIFLRRVINPEGYLPKGERKE